jgi:hypothetical protein
MSKFAGPETSRVKGKDAAPVEGLGVSVSARG